MLSFRLCHLRNLVCGYHSVSFCLGGKESERESGQEKNSSKRFKKIERALILNMWDWIELRSL